MKCAEVEIIISAYLDGEVTASEWREAETHIRGCKSCSAVLALFSQSTTFVQQEKPLYEPSAALWPKIASRLGEVAPLSRRERLLSRWRHRLNGFILYPSPAVRYLQVAVATAAVVLVAVMLFRAPVEQPASNAGTATTATRVADLPRTASRRDIRQQDQLSQAMFTQQLQNYFDKAGLLLLDLKHIDPDSDRDVIRHVRTASRSLLEQTVVIKQDLKNADAEMLSQVVDQLEVVLYDLANIKDKPEKDEVALLRATIGRQDLLIKIEIIDLEKMLRLEPHVAPPPEPPVPRKKPMI